MPELAEIKIASDFFNSKSRRKKCIKIVPNINSKVSTDLSIDGPFKITSKSRGKELMFIIKDRNEEERKLLLFFGMSGFFKVIKTDADEKKARLTFYFDDHSIVGFFDNRSFSKWKWVDDWSPNRGPCPVTEFKKFKANIKNNMDAKAFKKPLHVVLLNQKYFNGIGNYLRSTIIYNLKRINPDTPFNELDIMEVDAIIESCRLIPAFFYFHQAYAIINKDNYDKDDILAWDDTIDFLDTYRKFSWVEEDNLLIDLITSTSPNALLFYGVGCSKKDSTGRTFWYDCKWDNPNKILVTYRTIP